MGSSQPRVQERPYFELNLDLFAAAVVLFAIFIFWAWSADGSTVNDFERLSLEIFNHTAFAVPVLVSLRFIARGLSRRFPDRLRLLHRLAALSNRTVMFAVLPFVAATGVLLALSAYGTPHVAGWVWVVQFGLIFAIAGVQTWRKAPFLPTDFYVKVLDANANANANVDAAPPATDPIAGEPSSLPAPCPDVDAPPPGFRRSADRVGSLLLLSGCAVLAGVLVLVGEAMLAPYLPWTTLPLKTNSYRETDSLPDGNTLTIYPGSLIRVRYSLTRREIEIDRGGALLDVCPCHRQTNEWYSPDVIVRAGSAVVTVASDGSSGQDANHQFVMRLIGEKTEVLAHLGNLELASVTGRSGSAAPQSRAIRQLNVRDLAIVTPYHTEVRNITPQEQIDRLAWTHGVLSFKETPLDEVVTEVNQVADRPLQIEDPAIASVPVTGDFRMADLPNLAERVVVALERDGKVRRVPETGVIDPIQLVAYDADPNRYGPVEAQVSADLCASYRGVHDDSNVVYDFASPDPVIEFNLAGCDVPTALAGFSQQTGFQYEMVTAPTTAVTHPIKGDYSVRDALATMLNGTGCRATGDVRRGLKIACTES